MEQYEDERECRPFRSNSGMQCKTRFKMEESCHIRKALKGRVAVEISLKILKITCLFKKRKIVQSHSVDFCT